MKCFIIDNKFNFKVIMGCKFMREAEFKFHFSNNTEIWYDKVVSFQAHNYFSNNELIKNGVANEPVAVAEAYIAKTYCTAYVDLAAKYRETDTIEFLNNQARFVPQV